MVDVEKIMERTGGDEELLLEIVAIFVDGDCGNRMNDIRDALASEDAEALHRAAHTFKGAVANFEAPPAFETALLIEGLARESRFEDARAAFVELEIVVDALCAELNGLRQKSNGAATNPPG